MARIWLSDGKIITKNVVTSSLSSTGAEDRFGEDVAKKYDMFFNSFNSSEIILGKYLRKEKLEVLKTILKSNLSIEEKQLIIHEINIEYERLLYDILNVIEVKKVDEYDISKVTDLKKGLEENHLETTPCDNILNKQEEAELNSDIITLGLKLRGSIIS